MGDSSQRKGGTGEAYFCNRSPHDDPLFFNRAASDASHKKTIRNQLRAGHRPLVGDDYAPRRHEDLQPKRRRPKAATGISQGSAITRTVAALD